MLSGKTAGTAFAIASIVLSGNQTPLWFSANPNQADNPDTHRSRPGWLSPARSLTLPTFGFTVIS
jgi:hypothetical protein